MIIEWAGYIWIHWISSLAGAKLAWLYKRLFFFMMPPRNHFALRTQSRCFFAMLHYAMSLPSLRQTPVLSDSHWMPKAGDSMLLPTGHGRCELLQRIVSFWNASFGPSISLKQSVLRHFSPCFGQPEDLRLTKHNKLSTALMTLSLEIMFIWYIWFNESEDGAHEDKRHAHQPLVPRVAVAPQPSRPPSEQMVSW